MIVRLCIIILNLDMLMAGFVVVVVAGDGGCILIVQANLFFHENGNVYLLLRFLHQMDIADTFYCTTAYVCREHIRQHENKWILHLCGVQYYFLCMQHVHNTFVVRLLKSFNYMTTCHNVFSQMHGHFIVIVNANLTAHLFEIRHTHTHTHTNETTNLQYKV